MSENPWLSIWVRPKETIQKIVSENPNRSLWLLAAIYGFSALLNLFQSMAFGNALNALFIFVLALILCWIWGYVVFSFWSWVVSVIGKIFRGQGSFKAIRAAYAWSCVPLVFNVLFWLILIAIYGRELFVSIPEESFSHGAVALLFVLLIAKVVLAIWSLVIYINALAEVQKFSILRSIGNIVLSAVVVLAFFTLIWMAIGKFGQPRAAFQLIFESYMK